MNPPPPSDPALRERTRYYPRMVVAPDDLDLTQNHAQAGLDYHALTYHGTGVHVGAVPRAYVPPPVKPGAPLDPRADEGRDTWVVVGPGHMIDPIGRAIAIPADVVLDLTQPGADFHLPQVCPGQYTPAAPPVAPAEGTHYLAVRYTEAPTRYVRAPLAACGDRPDASEATRIESGFAFRLFQHVPTKDDAPWVTLGQLQFRDKKLVPGSVSGEGRTTPDGRADRVAAVGRELRELQAALPANVLGRLLTSAPPADRLRDAGAALEGYKRNLLKGLRVCLRPEGVRRLFSGLPPGRALARVPAEFLDYGPADGRLDDFLRSRGLTVIGLEESLLAPLRTALAGAVGDPDGQRGRLLETAWRAAGVVRYLVHQWPGSYLDMPDPAP